jgi:hypothetical protein
MGKEGKMSKPLTANEVLAALEKDNPNLKFKVSDTGNAVGVWSEKHGRYQTCVGKLLTGHWVQMKSELLIDGVPADKYSN